MKQTNATLQAHKGQSSTTLTDLLLVDPDGARQGYTLLDTDVVYDDGNGAVTFKARTGFESSAMQASSDLGVDNAEATTLMPIAGFLSEGFTQAQVDAGELDKTPFVVYQVNYKDLTPSSHEIMHGGTVGEQVTKFGQFTVLELRSLAQQAKQTIGELDSLTCRAKFGSMPIGTGGGVVEERFPCGFDISGLWVTGTVEAIGVETDREFTDATALTQAVNYFAPGVCEWLTGSNAGQKCEVESFALGGAVSLQFPTVNPILLGDTYRIRPDCTKRKTGHNSCKDTFWLTDWFNHFRGEPAIPVAEAAKLLSPGAALPKNSSSGTGE